MIEVMAALVILSIGLLGTAALQMQSKRANLGSVERTLASMLVNDMFERMRANPSVLSVYLTQLDSAQQVGKGALSEPEQGCSTSNPCTPAQLAEWDVWDWERLLIGATEVSDEADTGGLVLPLACMTGPAGGGEGVYTLAIAWRGHSEFAGLASVNNCGLGTGRYDSAEGVDTLRRMIVVSSYLSEFDE